jgi:hypothetical protein
MECDTCHNDADHYVRKLTRFGFRTQCRSCQTGKVRPSVYNPFAAMDLDHVRTSDNRPVHVSSLRQLREIEKEHKCVSLVANSDEKHFDDPPQQKQGSAFDTMTEERRWLHPEIATAMLKDMRDSGEI